MQTNEQSSLKIAATGISWAAMKKRTSEEMHQRNKELCISSGKGFYCKKNGVFPWALLSSEKERPNEKKQPPPFISCAMCINWMMIAC